MRIIVNDQAREVAPRTSIATLLDELGLARRPVDGRRGRSRLLSKPRRKPKRGSLIHLAPDPYLATHHMGKLLGDRKSETGTAETPRGGGIRLLEHLDETFADDAPLLLGLDLTLEAAQEVVRGVDLLPDLLDLLGDVLLHGPGRLATADFAHEVAEHDVAAGGVVDLGVELKAVPLEPI